MKIETGVRQDDLTRVAEDARRVEALGYDGIVTAHTGHDPLLPLAIAAVNTERITLGTAVLIAFPRTPMVTAMEAWDLQKASKGRLLLGLGTQVKGHNIRRFSVEWLPPGPRLREYIQCMRAIWDCWQNGTKPEFVGQYYQFTLMTPFFNPGPIEHPHIPIYISAVNPYNCRTIGMLCDGARIHGFNTPRYLREVILPNIEAGARKAGRSLKEIDIAGGGFVATGKTWSDVEQAREQVRSQVAFYASTRTYKAVLDLHGWGETCDKLNRMVAEGKWNELASQITDEMLDEFCVSGTYDDIVPRIQKHFDGMVTRHMLGLPSRTEEEREITRHLLDQLHRLERAA